MISGYGSPDYRVLTGLVVRSSLLSQKQISDPFKPISIYFDFDHANLSRDAQMYLDKQAAYLKEHPQSKLSVEGHTDSMGSDAYNQRLSEKRAGNALHYLKKKVSDTSRLKSVGYGETRPIDTNSTKEGRARNRRVDLRLIK